MASMAERMATAEAKILAIVDQRTERDREVRDLKGTMRSIDQKLDLLVEDKARRDGAVGLGRWLIAIGIPSLIGGAVLALWEVFGGHNG